MSSLRSSKLYLIAVVATAYFIAAAVAVLVARELSGLDLFWRLALADGAATLVIWIIGRSLRNSSLYDPYWSLAPPLLIAGYVFLGDGVIGIPRGGIVALLTLIWAWRLTWNCLRRWQSLDDEDFRYQDLRAGTGRLYPLVDLFGIQLFPSLLVFLGCLPFYAVFVRGGTYFNLLDVLAILVTAGAITLEWRADRTLWKFKESAAPGDLCTDGLWGRSRHPNYLGELGFWLGLWLFALAEDLAFWWTGVGFLAMALLFRFISIPMMEARKEARRPGYREATAAIPLLIPRWGGKRD